MEIKEIALGRMNNGAHYQFVYNTLTKAEDDAKINEKAATAVAALKETVIAEDDALKISQKSLLTDDIVAADRKRDELYMAYRKLVKGSLNAPLDEMAEAAKVLNQNIKDYGIDPQMQLDKETGLLANLLGDLTDKYASQVKTLGLTAYVTALETANDAVNALIMQRAEENSVKVAGALKTARAATDEAYKKLIKLVNALMTVEGEEGYEDFANYMNEEIDRYHKEVLTAKKKSSTNKEA